MSHRRGILVRSPNSPNNVFNKCSPPPHPHPHPKEKANKKELRVQCLHPVASHHTGNIPF